MRSSIFTVLGPTNPVHDLTTVDEVNAALGLESNTANDGITAAQITSASKLIADLCNRTFAMLDISESFRHGLAQWLPMPMTYSAGHAHSLVVQQFPINVIDSVTVGGTALDASNYEVDKEKGMLYTLNWSWCGEVVVAYSGGFDLPIDAPPALEQACIELVAIKRRQSQSAKHDPAIREVQHGDTRIMYFDYATSKGGVGSVPDTITDLIEPYVRLVV